MTLVKICGIRRPEDVACVNAAMPDMAGFVFHPPSPRHVTPADARALSAALDPRIATVGVFVDESPSIVSEMASDGTLSAVQLHGSEDDAYIRGLRRMTGVPIIKSFIVRGKDDLEAAGSSEADVVLLDAGRGSGTRFDWSLLEGFGREYMLSGGLDPDNVGGAVSSLSPYGVDVSSGVETDGRKDPSKIARFVDAARSRA